MKQFSLLAFVLLLSLGAHAQGWGGGGWGWGGNEETSQAKTSQNKADTYVDQAKVLIKKFKLKKEKKDLFSVIYLNWQNDRFNAVNPTGGDQESEESSIDFDNLTREEADKYVLQSVNRQLKQIEVDKKYYKEFQSIVTPQQAAQIFLQDTNTMGNFFGGGMMMMMPPPMGF